MQSAFQSVLTPGQRCMSPGTVCSSQSSAFVLLLRTLLLGLLSWKCPVARKLDNQSSKFTQSVPGSFAGCYQVELVWRSRLEGGDCTFIANAIYYQMTYVDSRVFAFGPPASKGQRWESNYVAWELPLLPESSSHGMCFVQMMHPLFCIVSYRSKTSSEVTFVWLIVCHSFLLDFSF